MIAPVSVLLKLRTVVGNIKRRFDGISGSPLQSQVGYELSVDGVYVSGS